MKRFAAALTVIGVAFGMLAIGNIAFADNAIMGDFTTAYPATAGTPLASCSTCHTSVPSLNPYGSALRANGFNFGAIEGLDSDGDGVSNLQEIFNLTNPGVAQAAPPTTTAPSTTTTIATTTTSMPASVPAPTTVASAPGSTTTTTTPTIDQPALESGPASALPFNIGGVGTVWLAVEDGRLVIVEVDTSWEYSQEIEDDEVEIEFRSGDTEVEFEAELEDGVISTEIETEVEDDHDDDDEADDHEDDDYDDFDDHHDDDDDEDDDDEDDD